MSGDGLENLWLEDGRAKEKYEAGRLKPNERRYYENFHGLCSRTLDKAIYIRADIESALASIEGAIKDDPAHLSWYISAKGYLELADSEISFAYRTKHIT